MTATRRLAAILAADVAGYSRLIGADEGGTLLRLKAIRAELIDPTIAADNGRLVKTTGDSLLVEFSSVVDALACATEEQTDMTAHLYWYESWSNQAKSLRICAFGLLGGPPGACTIALPD